METQYLLIQTILAPLITAFVCALAGKRLKKNLGWVAFAGAAYTTAILAYVGVQIWTQGGVITETYNWGTVVFALKFDLLADGLSLPVALIMSIICAAMTIYSINYM